VFFSGLFLVASTLSSYAANSSNSESDTATVDPLINVVASNDMGSMTMNFTEDDITKAQVITSAAGDIDGEYYMLIASYQVCILSNALVGDDNDSAGILLKVAKSSTATFWKAGATGENPTTSGINQLTLYNAATTKKIPFLIQVTPAGYTKSANVFGSASSAVASGQTYAGQYTAVPFIIGGDAANMASTSVYLHDANATSSGSAVAHENLALDVYGAVNHYGLNTDLASSDVSSGTATTMGLAATENHTLGSCVGDQNPTDTVGTTSMLITIKLYANAAEMAMAPAGDYSAEYTIHYGDIDDQDGSAVYDTAAQGSDIS
jgi:hypothetical protein